MMDGAKLRDVRTRANFTQDELAQYLRVGSARTVRKWEAGERPIPGPVEALIEHMEARLDALTSETDNNGD